MMLDSLSWSNPIRRHKAIKEFRENLEDIRQDLRLFAPIREHNNSETTDMRTRETGAFVVATSIIGRDEDQKNIINLLLGACNDDEKIPVISIVGIGGMGKTTVAQLVYGCWVQGHGLDSKLEFMLQDNDIFKSNKSIIQSCQFDLKMWVYVSQNFDFKLLLQKILQSMFPADTNLQNLGRDLLQDRFGKEIDGKKYLLVLDDVENEDHEKWIKLKELLDLGAEGSKILATTRYRRAAKVMSSADSMIYNLKGLSEKDSWLLFEKMAFRGSKDEKLVQIGRDIVQKYGGVPLAIRAIGSLLYGEVDNKWEQIRDRHVSNVEDGNQALGNINSSEDIIPVLRISYDALSPKVKECFRYCSLFPKSELISKRMLLDIWMSNVCIETTGGQQIEDMLEGHLSTLYNRCFLEKLQEQKSDDDDADEYFKMHDLMHDLAKQVAGAEMFVVDSDVMLGSNTLLLEENIRHLSLTWRAKNYKRLESKGRRLRTLMQDGKNSLKKFLLVDNKLKSDFPVLRMLDLRSSCIDRVPDCVGKLIHLRYLDLSFNGFSILPDSIGKLWNLQTLLLTSCMKLEKLPVDIQKLINLQHLGLEGCDALVNPMPSGMSALKSLRTLCKFIVGDSESENTAKLEDLEPLLNLQGKLEIALPKKSTLKEETSSGEVVLSNKRGLMSLELQWSCSRYKRPGEDLVQASEGLPFKYYRARKEYVLASEDLGNDDMDILAKLQPPADLNELKVFNYEGLRFPPWADGLPSLLPQLMSVRIDGSVKCQHLPSFSKLPSLKSFTIHHLLSLEYMEENVPAASAPFFPSLEHFELRKLPKLKGWCSELAGAEEQFSLLPSFPNHLAQMRIRECPTLKMTSMPPAPIFLTFRLKRGSVISFREPLLREWDVVSPEEDENDLPSIWLSDLQSAKLSSPLTSYDNEFRADNVQLLMSMPWERFIRSIRTNLFIYGFNVFNIEPASIVEACFRRMPKYITSLEIRKIPEFKIFPKALRHLSDLRELLIVDCNDFTGECEEPSNAVEPWKGFEHLRCLRLLRLAKLVRIPMKILPLTSLQVLDIEACRELEVVSTEVSKLMINLKYLRLSQCKYIGVKSLQERSDMSNLEYLEIYYCKLESSPLQSLCQYEWLKHLKLTGISTLKYMQDDYSPTFSFPLLESIQLYRLPNLKDWCKGLASNNVSCRGKEQSLRQLFPRVSHLYMRECPSFNENSILLTSITMFIIGYWWSSAFPVSYCSSPGLLCVLNTDNVSLCKTVMLEQYHRGNPLTVVICRKAFGTTWRKLDLERVSSRITSLHLEESNVLYSPPQGLKHLTTLQSLSIVGYNSFLNLEEDEEEKQSEDEDEMQSEDEDEMQSEDEDELQLGWRFKEDKQSEDGMLFGQLKSLTHLEFRGIYEMKTLPQWVWYIPFLQEVQIFGCDNLELPDWVHVNFDNVSVPEKQGFRLVRKSSADGS